MKLKEFPLIAQGFNAIRLDDGVRGHIDTDAEVPKDWQLFFRITEDVLQTFNLKLVCDYFDYMPRDELEPGDTALSCIWLPCDDIDEVIMGRENLEPRTIKAVQEVFTQFFDGPLRPLFEVRSGIARF